MFKYEKNQIAFFAQLVFILTLREIKSKYKGSVLGPLWVLLYPLTFAAITTLVFSIFIKLSIGNVSYPLFVLSGLIIWNYFSKSLTLATKSLVSNRSLVVETSVTTEAIPLSYILSQFVDVIVTAILLLIYLIATGVFTNIFLLIVLPIYFFLFIVFIFGLSLLLSSINVIYKDTQNLLEPFLLFLFYLTPIVYNTSYIPDKFRWLMLFNPIALFLECFRNIMLFNSLPTSLDLILILIYSVASLTFGFIVFRKFKKIFADII